MRFLWLSIILSISWLNSSYSAQLLASDYRIFQGTRAWKLAQAIHQNDSNEIKKLLANDKKLVAVVDTVYGQTLLGLAVINLKYNAVKALLESGADPNAFNSYDGYTPIMDAIENGGRVMPNDPSYLNIILKYGGNPNLPSKKINKNIYQHHNPLRPLLEAAYVGNAEYAKILVTAGGNLYYDPPEMMYAAMVSRSPDMVLYLLSKGFDPKKPLFINSDPNYRTYVVEELRHWNFDLGSEVYKKKMQIVDILKKHGINYRKTKIPDDLYKMYDKSYLEKY